MQETSNAEIGKDASLAYKNRQICVALGMADVVGARLAGLVAAVELDDDGERVVVVDQEGGQKGVREGPNGLFRVVYRFQNEKLVELINRTIHAAANALVVGTANSYRFYFAV